MRRAIASWRTRARSSAGAALALALAAACSAAPSPDAQYPADACRRVRLTDAATGLPIVGAEDFAFDRERDRLFIAAYDRKRVERAARSRALAIPEGGIYRVEFSRLVATAGAELQADRLESTGRVAGGLRPHGLSYDAAAGEIAFVNRGYQKIDGRWLMTSRVERLNAELPARTLSGPAPCAANDLVTGPDGAVVSFDHDHCDWRSGVEDLLSLKRSGVADGAGAPLFQGAVYANGLERTRAGEIALAATRENSILILAKTPAGYAVERRIEVSGGPDNLTLADDGGIVAAVHPSLLRLALVRRLGLGRAPSRVVKIDPRSGDVLMLFDDPSGGLFSGATVAVERDGALILGSATDAGLLACEAP
jgi:hypothetical protein